MTSASCQQTAEDWFNSGNSLIAQGEYDKVIKALDKAIIKLDPIDPNLAVAWNNKGNALNDMGNSMNPSSLTMRPSGWIQNKHQTTIQNVVPPQDATEYDTASIDLLSYYCSSNRCQE